MSTEDSQVEQEVGLEACPGCLRMKVEDNFRVLRRKHWPTCGKHLVAGQEPFAAESHTVDRLVEDTDRLGPKGHHPSNGQLCSLRNVTTI